MESSSYILDIYEPKTAGCCAIFLLSLALLLGCLSAAKGISRDRSRSK